MNRPPAGDDTSADPRRELARLVGEVRQAVARDIERGHRLTSDPELRAFALRKGGPALAASASVASPPPAPPVARVAPAPATIPARTAEQLPPAAARPTAEQGPATTRPAATPAPESKPVAKSLPSVGLPAADPRPLAEITAELTRLAAEAAECRKCGLCETRTRVVYGTGTARQPLMFVGEAPGFNEDQEGVPFVGRAGKLLTDIITAMGFDRAQIYIANVLKCRPPENRDPLPHETAACYPWLERQIELVQPRVICTVGSHSARLLTGRPKDTIGTLRGKVHYYKGIPVVPTYHPAFLLRSPGYKRFTWEDVQLVRDLYLKNDAPRQSEVGGLPSGEPT